MALNPNFFFFNDTATTEIYTLSLHDALPIWSRRSCGTARSALRRSPSRPPTTATASSPTTSSGRPSTPPGRSEEHTSELQSRQYLVCRLLLEKKNKTHLHLSCITHNSLHIAR